MKFTALIPTKDRVEECVNCVKSMLTQTIQFHEIIVVEGGKTNNLLEDELIKLQTSTEIKIIYIGTEKSGLTYQRNLGIQSASGDVIFMTDDDTILDANCLESMTNTFSRGDVDGVQPLVIEDYKPSYLSSLLRKVFLLTDQTSSEGPYMKKSGFPCLADKPAIDMKAEVFCGVTSFKRNVYNSIKFDENLVGYGAMEDIDLSYRASKKYNLWISSNAKVYHYPSPRNRENLSKKHKLATINYWYLFKKNLIASPITLLAFAWANVGLLTFASINSLRWRTISPIKDIMSGIIHSIIKK